MKLVYIIENGSGHKKIGVTSNIEKRITQLNTAVSTGIKNVVISISMMNAYTIEKQLHEANKQYRLNGEWFSEISDFCGIEFFCIVNDNKYIFRSFHVVNNEFRNPMLHFSQPNAKMSVWDYLTRNMVGWNKITVIQSQLSQDLGITRQHLGRTLKFFEDNFYIIKDGKSQSNNIYMLNPMHVWNGSAEDHEKANAKFCALRDKKRKADNKPKTVPEEPENTAEDKPHRHSD